MRPLKRLFQAAAAILLASTPLGGAVPFEGTVAAVDRDAGTLTIDGGGSGSVSGKAGNGDLAIYGTGDRIRGRLEKGGGQQYLENLWPADAMQQRVMLSVNQRLRRDTAQRGTKAFRSVGERLPEFALWDQHGKLVQVTQLAGHTLVINFIFTRCTNPVMCPASTLRMSQLQDAARDAGLSNVRFVSFTLDAEYDTPGILNAYAASYEIEPDTFLFLGGDKQALADLKEQLGILAQDDPRFIINHTMRTLIVAPGGRIHYQVPGSGWDMSDFLDRIQKLEAPAE